MKIRPASVLAWICTILVAAFYIFSAVMKFVPVEAGSPAEAMAQRLGIVGMQQSLGILQFIIVILYLVPRTSTIGFVLMVGYMGGALATNLTHGFTHMEALPMYITFALMTIAAAIRNPELLSRVLKRPVVLNA